MILNAARKEVTMSDNQALSEQEAVGEVTFRSVTPNDRKHKYEEGGDLPPESTSSRASKCQRSNSLGSYFVPIVPSIENSVQESQLQFDELEIVDTVNLSCQKPESVFHFIPVTDSNHANRACQDESRVSLCSDSKCTSNFADEHVLSCSHPSCDDLNSDPRFFQSQSAPAQLLTDESEHLLQHPNITTNTSPSTAFPAISEASPKSPSKVTSASDFEYKLFDVSSAEKRRRVSTSAAREDVNAEDFDNYTTGESSLCDSSRRSLAPHRSPLRSPLRDYYTTESSSSRRKVSLTGGDVYTDHSSRSTHGRSNSSQGHYRGRSVTRSFTSGYSIGRTEGQKSRERSKNRGSDSSTERSRSKGIVSSYSRHTTHTSYSYTTHHMYSHSYRHDRVDSRYSEYTEVTHSVPTPPSNSYSSYRGSSSRERRKVSNGYDTYTNNYTSGYHTDTSPSHIHTHTSKNDTHQNSSDTHSSIQPISSPRRAENNTLSTVATTTTVTTDPDNFRYYRGLSYRDLPLEWWERTEHCKEAKLRHTDRIDHMCGSRESLVLKTTLWKEDIVLEPNMFPYYTPYGVEHYTLWSVEDLSHQQIVTFVDGWLYRHMPHVRRWQYDDNSGERSIDLFHVHVFIETAPFQYAPREGMLYIPPHATLPVLAEVEGEE